MDDDDDFGDFGGFEAADPVEVQEVTTATATPSQWAVFTAAAVQNVSSEEKVTAQDEPTEEKKETRSTHSTANSEETTSTITEPIVTDQPPEPTQHQDEKKTEDIDTKPKNGNDVTHIPWPTVHEPVNIPQEARSDLCKTASGETLPSTDVSDSLEKTANESLSESPMCTATPASLQAVQNHRDNLLKELERMSADQTRWNQELEECKAQLVHQVDRYNQLQVVHGNAITEMRNAGHEALSVIVAEYKEFSKTTLAHQKETTQTELLAAIHEQNTRWQHKFKEQEEHTRAALAEQKSKMTEELEEALETQREQLQEKLKTCLKEEREEHVLELKEALEAEREASKTALEAALKSERQKLLSQAREDKVKTQSLVEAERQKSTDAIKKALEEERSRCQECIKTAMEEQRAHSQWQAKQMMEEAHREVAAYVHQQQQADTALRLRSLSTMDLFLEGTRKQLDALMKESQAPSCTEETESKPGLVPKL